MKMPEIVRAYFDADSRDDPDTLTALFAADAVVRDEGGRYDGVVRIRSWWAAAREKYCPVAEPIEVTEAGERVSVRAKVSGNFPNSPALINFIFTVKNDKIVLLEIK
ncbi:nuclear transport factor 2 family protein [Erwinia sp. P6884]|uniref:nuclear transport factor 2 family protein n=1 Tax=Erwinia sp. P6884 TaxID=3141450 RepID=UPI00319B6C20